MRAEPATTRRNERPRERPTEPPAHPVTAPAPATGARGAHDLAAVPVAAPREVSLWRRPSSAAATAAAPRRRPPLVQAKLRVSRPGDALEQQADAVATRVVRGGEPVAHVASGAPRPRIVHRAATPIRGPPPAGLAQPTTTVPSQVESVIAGSRGGLAIDPLLRARIEPHVGADLSSIRIRAGPDANAAARALGARAFASGGAIYLAASESLRDVALIAHEAAHVAQQQSLPAARTYVLRQAEDDSLFGDISITDVIPEWVLDEIRSAVRAIPGYDVLSAIAGRDLLTGRPSELTREQLIEKVLTYGPFGAAVGPVLSTIGVLEDVFSVLSEGLVARNLTVARFERDVAAAWDELSVTNGLDANVAVVRRYIDALLRDVSGFVGDIAERIIAVVRGAIAAVAAPLLETPQIKPVWDLARKVLHYDPLLGQPVDATTVEILTDFLRLIGKEQALQQMQERGTLQETADWIDTQLETFAGLITDLGTLFSDAWNAIQPANLPEILDTLPRLAARAFGLIGRVADFATTVIAKVLELIKNALLGWLSEHAHQIPGFHLVTVIIGRNPFTGEAVPRTAENLIKGFITLMPNGEATYEKLAESGVVAEAAARIESAMATLGISWELIVGTFQGIWESLSLEDLLDPPAAFDRVVERFGEPISRLFAFIRVVVETVVSLVLRLMNFPSELLTNIIANVQRAIGDIQRDPVRFILNMLEALKAGFLGFLDRIGTYLLQGLADWVLRGLGQLGVTIPADLTLPSILQLVLDVLGLSIETLWTKLGQHIGPERVAMIRAAIEHLTGAWAFIQAVQQRGLVAIWEYVTDQLSGLWDMILQQAQEWITTTIVTNVVERLISMLDPTGIMAVVNSFVAFFRAVQSVIEYVREILQIVDMYVSTVAQIAAGNIQPGAEMVERGLAAAIPIAIGFLANQVGIGNIPERVVEIIQELRQLIDRALDWLIAQAVRLGSAALSALTGPAQPAPAAAGAASAGDVQAQTRALVLSELSGDHTPEEAEPILAGILEQMRPAGLRSLQLGPPSAEDESRTIVAEASPAMPLAKLIPRGTVPQGRSVRVVARITLSAAATVPGRRLAAVSPAARTPEGDELLAQAAPAELVVVGWNTSNIATWNNDSHAEHQLVSYLERARVGGQRLMTMIQSIQVNILNYSPCAMCTDELASVLEDIADARGRTFVGTSEAILAWRDYYPGFQGGQAATTWQGIGRLSRAGWTLRAPASGHPQATGGVQSAGFYENAHRIQPL